ncbi:hypothetical protein [uncultured Algibacter sp.]|uniref:hypothetical protein n=1 Tax=uncultured Algibacter sp. TaxID=298659 RepID=UPI00262892F7|nr:hypothetical protein [uncultured Algibacter sp.]
MTNSTNKPPIWLIVSIIALVWNAMGVNAYLQQAYNTESYQAMYSKEQLEIASNMPAWVTAAFALAVFAGALAAIGLLLKKSWSVKLWLLSLLAVIIQMGYTLINGYESSMVMTIMIIVFAFIFIWFSRKSEANRWLS